MKKRLFGILMVIFLLAGVGLYANYTKQQAQPYAVTNEPDVVGTTTSIRICKGEEKTFTAAEFGATEVLNVNNNSGIFGETYVGGGKNTGNLTFWLYGSKVTDDCPNYYITLNLDDVNTNIPCKVVEPQFRFANNAKTKIKYGILTKYIKDNNDQAFPSTGYFATGTFSTTTPNIINLDSITGLGEELNLSSVGEGFTDFSIMSSQSVNNYTYSTQVGDVETYEVYAGDAYPGTQLILYTYTPNIGEPAGTNYAQEVVSYPEDMLDTTDPNNWTFKTPGTYTLIIGAGNTVDLTKKAFMYTFEVKERTPIEEITIDRRASRSVGHTDNIIDAGYYHVSPEDAEASDVTLTPEDPTIAYVESNNDIFANEYGHTKIKIASKADPNVNADLDYYVTAGISAYVGYECENEMPYKDDEGEYIDEDNITSIISENPDIFTVSYTPGNDMKLTGLKAGVGKIRLVEDTGGTYPKYHYVTVESFVSIKNGQVNQKWSMTNNELKNAKNMNGYPYDGGDIDSDNAYAWHDDDEIELTVNENGISFTPETTGPWTIWFQTENGESYEYYVNVIDGTPVESVTLDTTSAEILKGKTLQLTATVLPEDATNKDVTWSSNNESVATVDAKGKVTAVAEGEATITCASVSNPSVTATCAISVFDIHVTSITLNTTSAEIAKGKTLQLTATVLPEEATNKDVTWTSSNKKVATVDANGKVKAVAKGKVTITCASVDNPSVVATCAISVFEGIAVKSVSLSEKKLYMNVGEKEILYATINPENATKKGVKWYTSDSSIAYVSQIGKVYAKGRGTATITVVTKDGNKKATCKVYVSQPVKSVKLNKNKEELFLGETDKLVATVLPEDANKKTVKWSSTDSSIVYVSQVGKIYAKGVGTATIKVTTVDGGYTATCEVKVLQPVTGVKILNTGVRIKKGASRQLTAVVYPTNAECKDVIWSSSNTNILKVNQKGKVTGVKAGTAYVTVTTVDGGYKDKVAVYVSY